MEMAALFALVALATGLFIWDRPRAGTVVAAAAVALTALTLWHHDRPAGDLALGAPTMDSAIAGTERTLERPTRLRSPGAGGAWRHSLQFAYDQLPCPLCLLQRVAFCLMAAGLVFNLRYGPRARGYGLILLAAAVGGATGVRQILLHIAPGDPGYGMPVFGLHDYTWATIIFAVAIVATGIVLLFDWALVVRDTPRPLGRLATVALWLALLVMVAQAASALAECGFAQCPDNPVSYELLSPSPP